MKKHFIIFIIIEFLISCNSQSSSTLNSKDYESRAERIEKLKIEIIAFSDFQDAEFELFNVNGFQNQRSSVPGASSLDYKFVVKVDTLNISKWTTGMTKCKLKNYDDSWTKDITKHRKQNWETNSEAQYFVRKGENVTTIIYKNEGIIFKRVVNL